MVKYNRIGETIVDALKGLIWERLIPKLEDSLCMKNFKKVLFMT